MIYFALGLHCAGMAEVMGLVKDIRMSNERLEEALGKFSAWTTVEK